MTATQLQHYYETIEGHFWFRAAYSQILAALPTSRVSHWVEVGVFQGQSLAWLGVEALNRQIPLSIYAVDTFEGWEGTLRGSELREAFDRNVAPLVESFGGRFQVHAGASVDIARYWPDQSMDVVWLDADHRWAQVTADIKAWLPKVRSGGVIGGDDWDLPGVQLAVSEAFGDKVTLFLGERLGASWPSWVVRV